MKIAKTNEVPPPKHFGKRAAAFWRALNEMYILEAHDLERLRTAAEQIQCIDDCVAAIARDGRFVPDRYGCTKPHPAVDVAHNAHSLLLKAIREMAVDIELPENRLPRQGRRYA